MDTTPESTDKPPRRWQRWVWFVAIWLGSVLALTLVSKLIRWAIMP